MTNNQSCLEPNANCILGDRVLGMTYSEFGRRVQSNGTGTDHGSAGPMFLFGKQVNAGILGVGGLKGVSEINNFTNTTLEYDYRAVYSAIIEQWFGGSSTNIISAPTTSLDDLNKIKDFIIT